MHGPGDLRSSQSIWGLYYFLEGHGDLISGLIMGIIGVIIWLIGFLTYLLSPHDPPSSTLVWNYKGPNNG